MSPFRLVEGYVGVLNKCGAVTREFAPGHRANTRVLLELQLAKGKRSNQASEKSHGDDLHIGFADEILREIEKLIAPKRHNVSYGRAIFSNRRVIPTRSSSPTR